MSKYCTPYSKVLQPQPFALSCSNLAVEVGSSHKVLPALAEKLGAHTIIAEDEVEHVWREVSLWPTSAQWTCFHILTNSRFVCFALIIRKDKDHMQNGSSEV